MKWPKGLNWIEFIFVCWGQFWQFHILPKKMCHVQSRNNHFSGLTWLMGKYRSPFYSQQLHSQLLKKVSSSPSQTQNTGAQIIISWRKSMKTSLMNAYCCCSDELSPLTFSEEVLGDYIKVYCELETWMEWTVNLSLSLNCCLFFFFWQT